MTASDLRTLVEALRMVVAADTAEDWSRAVYHSRAALAKAGVKLAPSENEKLTQQRNGIRIALNDALSENAALREDAERYRWLRDHGDDHDNLSIWCYYDGIHMQQGAELDAAIDAARGVK